MSSAPLGGPYNALLRSPEMARRCFELLDYLRFKTSVNKRLNEFAILIQARIANAQLARLRCPEWRRKKRPARKAWGQAHWVLRSALGGGGPFTLTRLGPERLRIETTGWSGTFVATALAAWP